MKYKVPFIKPSFPEASLIAEDYSKIVENNWFTNFGPYEQKFRREAAEFIDESAHACTVANATLGLDIAVRSLFKSGEQSQVLVPSFTFAAGPEVLISNNLTPVFIDIDNTVQPDINQAKEYIENHRADMAGILLCNTFGTGNESIKAWEEMATEYGLPMIIDSAAGFGSEYTPGERIGLRGDCEVFSFHATKPFAVGEGGLIVSKSESLIQQCRELQNFGFGTDRHIEHIGTNAKMQEINSAIGLHQLGGFAARLANRRESLGRYKEYLSDMDFSFQQNDDLSTVAFVSAIAPTAEIADDVFKGLHQRSVEARRYYQPLHLENKLARHCLNAFGLERTEEIASRLVSLPLHDNMQEDDIQYIQRAMKDVL